MRIETADYPRSYDNAGKERYFLISYLHLRSACMTKE